MGRAIRPALTGLRQDRIMSLPARATLLAAALLACRPAAAQEDPRFPACPPAREGISACMDGKLCLCRYQPGGTLTGRPAGLRWDCGALRPACGFPPADIGGNPAPALPPIFLQPNLPAWPGERGAPIR